MDNQAFEPLLAIGLMSGTSLDGVDVVALRTDGEGVIEILGHHYLTYDPALKARLRDVCLGDVPLLDVLRLERDLSGLYARAVVDAMPALGLRLADVAVVGVHGQTVRHLPAEGLTWQLGDPSRVLVGLREGGYAGPVVIDFRRQDLAWGGEGAPLVPLFHAALMDGQSVPLAVLNLGGVANVTLLGAGGDVKASDCGPAMGLLDQLFLAATGSEIDEGGAMTLAGRADMAVAARLDDVPFYRRPVPRSADRYEFAPLLEAVAAMPLADAAATLAAATARGVAKTVRELGGVPGRVVWCGGGGRNAGVLKALENEGFTPVSMRDLGIAEDRVEAACFGWLAVRRLRGLPFTLPGTTGARAPSGGGVVAA